MSNDIDPKGSESSNNLAATVEIERDIAPFVRIGVVSCAPVRVGPASPELKADIQTVVADLVRKHAGRAPGEIEGLQPARRLYRAFGIDPTSTRPSSEALLRRVLKGGAFPEVNAAVDAGNLCSVSFLLPIGLYDSDKIQGAITLRRGRAGEGYAGIRKDWVNVEGRPTLVDGEGPFGNPTSDSARTSVDDKTSSLLMIVFAPAETSDADLARHVAFADRVLGDRLRT
jgi:DNA/RNA-binding domain of Phe-tRNA-synthetase-like protein